ncbi:MAG: hypothetical protein IKD78_06150, partial [Bacteroidales bacterium]|nr:hypothetical protein [Bacteroidales bacterium]
ISFKACATPTEHSLASAQTNDLETVFAPGERGLIKAFVDVSPANKIGFLAVYGVLTRCNGNCTITTTNELENVLGENVIGGIYYEKQSDVEKRDPFDAGETAACSVIVKYKTNDPAIQPYGKIEADGFAYECSDLKEYMVGKLGSVWINEIGSLNGECFVELCGTTNRTYLSGWQAVLSSVDKAYTNDFNDVFDFKTNMVNGVVGIETHHWADLDNAVLENATLELKNSAGIVEFSKTGISFPGHYQMTGKAKWHGVTDDDWSYDWTGTSTNTTFMFEESMEACTPNKVNEGQGFRVPVKTMLYLTTAIEGSTDTLPYAAIDIAVDGILNGEEGVTNFLGQTSEETGTAAIEIRGYSDDASSVVMTSSVAAFAWKCEDLVTTNSMYCGELFLTNVVSPAVAYDDFSVLKGYWDNWSNVKNMQAVLQYWGIGIDGKRKDVLQLDTRGGYKGYATLTTKSYMSTRGKKYLDVSFDFTNESNLETNHCTTVKVLIADSPDFEEGTTCSTVALDNKSTRYGSGDVYPVREFIELPEKFAQDDHVWLRIHATKNYQSTSVYTTIDNLRVAAQDSVKINELKIDEPMQTGVPFVFPSDVELDITPLTGGIVSNFVE